MVYPLKRVKRDREKQKMDRLLSKGIPFSWRKKLERKRGGYSFLENLNECNRFMGLKKG